MILNSRLKANFLHTEIIFAVLCSMFLFFISCVSVPAEKETAYMPEKNDTLVQKEDESVISLDDTAETKKSPEKKSSGKGVKKLTVIYDEEKAEEPDLLAQYKISVDNIKINPDRRPPAVKNGNAFASGFSVFVTDTQGMPVNNAGITVKYPSDNLNGTIVFASEDITSDEDGKAVFTSPPPEFSCLSEILFYITPGKTDEAVLRYAEEKALRMPYEVYTDKINKTISVSVLDYTVSGKPVRSNGFSSSAFLKALYKKGFRRAGNADFIDEINSGDAGLLHRQASSMFGGAVDYLIFGTVKYDGPVAKDEELYTIKLNAELSVMEMKSGNIVLNTKRNFTAQGTDEWRILEKMRNTIIAPALADFVYYNF